MAQYRVKRQRELMQTGFQGIEEVRVSHLQAREILFREE